MLPKKNKRELINCHLFYVDGKKNTPWILHHHCKYFQVHSGGWYEQKENTNRDIRHLPESTLKTGLRGKSQRTL